MNVPSENKDMPKGIYNAYWFQVYNSFSWPIIIGMPMLLIFKRFGASATILGIATAMSPFFNILQIPAANYVERIGYRSFVLRGWALRSVFILFFAVVAVLPRSIDATTKIVLMLGLLAFYNISRGISACGFLPWLTQLVPEEHRGTYISRDQMFGNLSLLVCSLLASLYLRWNDSISAFAGLYFIAFVTAMMSLAYLKKIPDVAVPESSRSPEGVPWKAILNFRPFTVFLAFNCLLFVAWAGSGVLQVTMMRGLFNYSDSNFLMLGVITCAMFIFCIYFLSKIINRVGNKPFLAVSLTIQIVHMLGWALIGAKIVPLAWWSVILQQGSWGVAAAFFGLANTRMVMSIVPEMGRSHFFAVFSVGQNLVLGLCPVLWGLMIDACHDFSGQWGAWTWNPYCLGYLIIGLIMIASAFILSRVEEAKAMTTEGFFRELLVNTPARAISRIMVRRTPL
jgi:MFS family permease